jgi:hypothetical protein
MKNYIAEQYLSNDIIAHTTKTLKTTSRFGPSNRSTSYQVIPQLDSTTTPSSTDLSTTASSTRVKPTEEIDMENEYHPFVKFSLVWPKTKPILSGRDYMVVVLITSGARGNKYRARRNAIRQTWGRKTSCEQSKSLRNSTNYKWLLVFSLGKTYSAEDKANILEARKNNDILIGDFEDVYINNIIKVYMGQLWVSTLNVRYILKTDDDVYVRVPATIDWLIERKLPTRFYGGGTYLNTGVVRNPHSKWGVSKKYFNETYFPPFNAGAFYVLSTDVLSELRNYVHIRRPFHTDDAYIGVAARDLKINVTHIIGFRIENNMASLTRSFSDCYLVTLQAFGHSLEPDVLYSLHNRVNDICAKNTTHSC